MTISTARLVLHPVDEEEARRIHDRAPTPDDRWAIDYPFAGDLAGLGALLRAYEQHGEQRPFGYYKVSLRSNGTAVGGIGFKGPPQGGIAEVGYGLAPSAREHGYATEALEAFVDLARTLDIRALRADTTLDNVGSQRVLEKAGFRHTNTTDTLRFYEFALAHRPGSDRT